MRKSARLLPLVAMLLPLVAAACGGTDDEVAKPNRDGVVKITMEDNRFEPNEVEVSAKQTVTFEFHNRGEAQHEAFIGSQPEQEAHELEMTSQSTHDSHMSESSQAPTTDDHMSDSTDTTGDHLGMSGTDKGMVTVAPGETVRLEYTFDEPGTLFIGCHEPGHYASGMRAEIAVK